MNAAVANTNAYEVQLENNSDHVAADDKPQVSIDGDRIIIHGACSAQHRKEILGVSA